MTMVSKSSTLQLDLLSIPSESQKNSFEYLEQTLSQIGKHKKLLVEKEEKNYKITIHYEDNDKALAAYQQFLNMKLEGFQKQHICFANTKPKRQPFADLQNERLSLKQIASNSFAEGENSNFKIARNSLLEKVKGDRNSSRSVKSRKSIVLKKGSSFKQSSKECKENQPISKFSTFKSTMPKSSVILVSNLDNCFKSAKAIFNLFSVFGNIEKILLMKNLQKVMVEYKNVEGAYACAININCLKIKNTELRVNYSKYQHIDLQKNNQNFRAKNFNEIYIPNEQDHRFDKDHKATNKKCSSSLIARVEEFFGKKIQSQCSQLIEQH